MILCQVNLFTFWGFFRWIFLRNLHITLQVTDVLTVAIKELRSNSSNRQNVAEIKPYKGRSPTAVFPSPSRLKAAKLLPVVKCCFCFAVVSKFSSEFLSKQFAFLNSFTFRLICHWFNFFWIEYSSFLFLFFFSISQNVFSLNF